MSPSDSYSEFLLHSLQRYSFQILKNSSKVGTTVESIDSVSFFSFKIPLPPPKEQKQIASILTSIDNRIQTQQQKLAKLQDLKKSLMQDLLTGKVRVKV